MPRPSFSALSVAAFALAGCGASAEEIAAVTALDGDGAAGAELYATHCEGCHGADAQSGSEGLDVAGAVADDVEGAISVILVGDGEMPAFGETLSDQDIADIVAHVETL